MARQRSILVTGGAGYIGSHTCKWLAGLGYEPVSYDNLVYGHQHAVKWGPLEVGDLNDTAKLRAVIDAYEPEAVIHFAAYSFVGESVTNPAKYYRNNVGGTLNLLEAMRETGMDKLVFSSTCATYGIPETMPIAESTPQNPINPYGRTKLIIETMLSDYSEAHGIQSVSLRYFNACGADREGEIGEEHEPETHLIPRVLMALTGEIDDFSVYGTDYDTPDGTCIRDYIHVDDLAHGHALALEYLFDGGSTESFNLGTGHGYSVKEIIDAVERVTERKVPLKYGARRPGDPPILSANTEKIRKVLGFETRYSDLDTIVDTAWRFHLSRHNRQLARSE